MVNVLTAIKTVRFTPAEDKEIQKAADADGRSDSAWVRQVVRAALRARKAKAAS